MRVAVFLSSKKRESRIVTNFAKGVVRAGDQVEIVQPAGRPTSDPDAALIFGIKSDKYWHEMKAAGVRVVYGDKGYSRIDSGWRYLRFCWDDTQPLDYLERARHAPDRWLSLKTPLAPFRGRGKHVIFAGSSAKFHVWHGIEHPTAYAEKVTRRITELVDRPVVYRVKPSWTDKEPVRVPGVGYSPGKTPIERELRGAHCLVTFGSNAGVDALIAGVPAIALGPAVFRSVAGTDLEEVAKPRIPTDEERLQFFANLAHCQWTEEEIKSGDAWRALREREHAG